jgi:fatty-acyl-CoA synthase
LIATGSVGCGAAHTQLRIVNKGAEAASGQPGELLLRGPNLFREYWRDPEATAAVLVDGWFRTGDIGFRDQRGFVFIHDRKKDMVISGGENIYPAELEQVLSGIPGIKEAAVVGIPDAKWGEIPVAVVVAVVPGTLTVDGICKAFEGVLARYKHPRAVVFTSVLPRNAMGKVLKHELRDALRTGTIEMEERP